MKQRITKNRTYHVNMVKHTLLKVQEYFTNTLPKFCLIKIKDEVSKNLSLVQNPTTRYCHIFLKSFQVTPQINFKRIVFIFFKLLRS